jgi:hypothetical protein
MMPGFCNRLMLLFCCCIGPDARRCSYGEGKEKRVVPLVSHRSTSLWRECFEERYLVIIQMEKAREARISAPR